MAETKKLFPVKLLRDYAPPGPYLRHMDDGTKKEIVPPPNEVRSVNDKAMRGWTIEIPLEEARRVVGLAIGERADGLTL